jgi:hypothetical protein
MTVSREVEVEVRRLYYAEHWKVGTIATQLSVHGDVVRRVLGLLERAQPSAPRPRLVEPYADFIAETLGQVLRAELAYAAPEVMRRQKPDGRADLYSLGMVLLEMLSGQERSINPEVRKRRDPEVGGEGAAPPSGFGCERHLLK